MRPQASRDTVNSTYDARCPMQEKFLHEQRQRQDKQIVVAKGQWEEHKRLVQNRLPTFAIAQSPRSDVASIGSGPAGPLIEHPLSGGSSFNATPAHGRVVFAGESNHCCTCVEYRFVQDTIFYKPTGHTTCLTCFCDHSICFHLDAMPRMHEYTDRRRRRETPLSAGALLRLPDYKPTGRPSLDLLPTALLRDLPKQTRCRRDRLPLHNTEGKVLNILKLHGIRISMQNRGHGSYRRQPRHGNRSLRSWPHLDPSRRRYRKLRHWLLATFTMSEHTRRRIRHPRLLAPSYAREPTQRCTEGKSAPRTIHARRRC